MEFSLVIPLFNESRNIFPLIDMLATSGLPQQGLKEVLLVNNGSSDDTGRLIDDRARAFPWIRGLHQQTNLNYGGGVYEGLRQCRTEIVSYIPGDLQVQADDLARIWKHYQDKSRGDEQAQLFVKGFRTVRLDGWQTRIVSRVYTALDNGLLGLRVKDVNGLPKMFHRDLLKHLSGEIMKTFVFDAQILQAARHHGWTIEEIPVTFHARREGVSTWSQKRIATYATTLRQILQLRSQQRGSHDD